MRTFPQLPSGAIAQLPMERFERYRTLKNVLSDGSDVRMSDVGAASVGWNLQYLDLTAAEAQALQSLFLSSKGRLHTFTFVDPTANLLCWSDELTQPLWNKDSQLALTQTSAPFGAMAATQIANGAAAAQSIWQTTSAPAGLQYCFSAYLRSDAPVQVTFEISGAAVLAAMLTTMWQRWEATASGGTVDDRSFGLSISPGSTIQVCGLQAEAQPSAGVYKSTNNPSGVFPNSRFDQDSLDVTATEAGLFACSVRVVSPC